MNRGACSRAIFPVLAALCFLLGGAAAHASTTAAELNEAAEAEYAAKRYTAAAALWALLVKQHPDNAAAWGSLSLVRFRTGEFKAGIAAGRRCYTTATGKKAKAACLYNQGLSFEALGKKEDAVRVWELSVALRPNKTVASRLASLNGGGARAAEPTLKGAMETYLPTYCPGARLVKFGGRRGTSSGLDGAGCKDEPMHGVTGSFTGPNRVEAVLLTQRSKCVDKECYRPLVTRGAVLLRFEHSRWGLIGHIARLEFSATAGDDLDVRWFTGGGAFQAPSGRDAPVLCSSSTHMGCDIGSCDALWFTEAEGSLTVRSDALFHTKDDTVMDLETTEVAQSGPFTWEDRDGDGRTETLRVPFQHRKTESGRPVSELKVELSFDAATGHIVTRVPLPDVGGC